VSQQPDRQHALSDEQLAEESAVDLPDREAMSVLRLNITDVDNFAMPINEAFAINNYSSDSIAMADADQVVIIDQAADQSPEVNDE
jgi:hypothetical protein